MKKVYYTHAPESAVIMTDLNAAMYLIISTFQKYAEKDGDKHTLSKSGLKELLENELGDFLDDASDKAEAENIFKDLDENKDNSVDFLEFGRYLILYTSLFHQVAVLVEAI
ncbi:ictacalcin-like [Xyrichtys novacula]|uniref:Ictacalcin-like n=1 Tax=Xyrichtys novacula TaxID=13765 RepID=A0AAV1HE33_XYRNO|nr:ictacalcin-like [Xyrichtys novacula]